jgi:abortive infection bacteriophage resistance protein
MIIFNKPAISPNEQLCLLEQRGLVIQDRTRALAFLKAVSYFRLTLYMRPFQTDSSHQFKPGTGFRQLAELYEFDRRLRLLVIDAIERAEVAIRAQLSNHMGPMYGSHWYLEDVHFRDKHQHTRLLSDIRDKQQRELQDYHRECQRIDQLQKTAERKQALKQRRQQESYARHYALTYSQPELLPNWAMVEEITLGMLSHLFKSLARDSDKKAIAKALGLESPLLESWLHTLTVVRNICAHHSRLWNRELGITPAQPKSDRILWPTYLRTGPQAMHTRIAVILPILQHFMRALCSTRQLDAAID